MSKLSNKKLSPRALLLKQDNKYSLPKIRIKNNQFNDGLKIN